MTSLHDITVVGSGGQPAGGWFQQMIDPHKRRSVRGTHLDGLSSLRWQGPQISRRLPIQIANDKGHYCGQRQGIGQFTKVNSPFCSISAPLISMRQQAFENSVFSIVRNRRHRSYIIYSESNTDFPSWTSRVRSPSPALRFKKLQAIQKAACLKIPRFWEALRKQCVVVTSPTSRLLNHSPTQRDPVAVVDVSGGPAGSSTQAIASSHRQTSRQAVIARSVLWWSKSRAA